MLCCLNTRASISSISRRTTRRPSIRLTTVRTCSRTGFRAGKRPGCGSRSRSLSPCGVLVTFKNASVFAAVILHASPGRFLPAVSFPAAEWTPQILAPRVARVGDKINPAMPTSGQARSQVRPGLQNRSQEQVILQHQPRHRSFPIPAGAKLELRCDLYCKKPKLSLRMPMLRKTTPSYWISPQGSRR